MTNVPVFWRTWITKRGIEWSYSIKKCSQNFWTLACLKTSNCSQKLDECSLAGSCSQNFCNCSQARILVKVCSILVWQNWETLGKHTRPINIFGNVLPRFADVFSIETDARKNSSRKATAKIESNLETWRILENVNFSNSEDFRNNARCSYSSQMYGPQFKYLSCI